MRSSKEINLIVKTIDSQIYKLSISVEKTVYQLKQEIEKSSMLKPKNQRLIYQGKVLKDKDSIQDYKIDNDHVVHLVKQQDPQNNEILSNNSLLENYLENRPNRIANMESGLFDYQNYFTSLLSSLNSINPSSSNNMDYNRILQNLNPRTNNPI